MSFVNDIKNELSKWTQDISLHKTIQWNSFPDIDLYMDQVITYMEKHLDMFKSSKKEKLLTSSMINNYVKDSILDRPVGKKYNRNHLAKLITISTIKQILSISEIKVLLEDFFSEEDIELQYDKYCNLQDDALNHVADAIERAIEVFNDEEIDGALRALVLQLVVEANARRIAAIEILSLLSNKK